MFGGMIQIQVMKWGNELTSNEMRQWRYKFLMTSNKFQCYDLLFTKLKFVFLFLFVSKYREDKKKSSYRKGWKYRESEF